MDIKSQNRHKIPAKRTFGRDIFNVNKFSELTI